MLIWLVVIVLVMAVAIMFWLLMQKQQHLNVDDQVILNLENKVESLELNLKQTLEVMQDLVKKMHAQQHGLDLATQKLKHVESQNIELVELLAKIVDLKDKSI